MARFRIDSACEVLRDPAGHSHHWTILIGVLEEGTLRIGDAIAVPRIGGGRWLGHVLGFERFREELGTSVDAAQEAGRILGVAIWGVAPPEKRVAAGDARVVGVDEAKLLFAELRLAEPSVVDHCRDCRRIAQHSS